MPISIVAGNWKMNTTILEAAAIASSMVDMEGSYQLTPSPDGTKTLYVHKAIQTDKIQIPISTDVQRSAIKETFVNQINAIKTQLGSS